MNMIATSNQQTAIVQAMAIFADSTVNIKADAWDFITGKKQGLKQALAFLGLASNKKMIGLALAIPARQTCPRGDKLAQVKKTICSICYAMKGHDAMAPAKTAKKRRWDLIKLALDNDYVRALWLKAFVICMAKQTHMRWHTAGDIFSAAYCALIVQACESTPHIDHWIPTKEPVISRPLQTLVNVVVRVSDDMIDQVSNKFKGPTSGCHTKTPARGVACPAPLQGGSCLECRACWDHDVKHVSYHWH